MVIFLWHVRSHMLRFVNVSFDDTATTWTVGSIEDDWWVMNWKWFGRWWSWPNWDISRHLLWRTKKSYKKPKDSQCSDQHLNWAPPTSFRVLLLQHAVMFFHCFVSVHIMIQVLSVTWKGLRSGCKPRM